ncbi:MAG: phospho-N-acetylmuramoyl-pentapeptide-transferase [Candidatus Eremiobacteraeota bacterium]|nr:phospho-N-acetylmuramoyl-pentapeptide-transferase [Candidatus Eremiobacteraeota bacterium]
MAGAISVFFLSFLLSAGLLPFYIRKVKELQWGQQIRPEGPQDHASKSGTPTMGGLVVLLVVIMSLLWVHPLTWEYGIFAAFIVINGAAGFFDDFIKIKKGRSLGLRARDKLFIHILLGIGIAWLMREYSPLGGKILVPFAGWVDTGWFIYPLCIAVMTGCVNAVNLTDGLDGLAAGSVIVTLAGYSYFCFAMKRLDLLAGCITLGGALLGFLAFNCFPARIFMGDTGSLALGGALATLSILTGTELFLFIMGGVYVVEALSVVIQVTYFKMTKGKRVFRMSPIHHHFALGGWHEVQVTTRFWIAGALLAALGVWIYRM